MLSEGSHVSSASGQAWKEGRLDVTGAMMVLTLKIISVAACYQDGGKPQEVHGLELVPQTYIPVRGCACVCQAWPPECHSVNRVELSTDFGRSWHHVSGP